MERLLGMCALRDRRALEISVLETPAPSRAEELSRFYSHKGPLWQHHVEAALARPLDALETRIYLGSTGGEVTTAITTMTHAGIGFVGHVYTEVAHRGRGASSALFEAMMADQRANGGRALYLTTEFGSTAYRIYQRKGFASRFPDSGEMEWFAETEETFLGTYFRPGACRVEPVRWEHWPLLNPLTARKGESVVSYALHDGLFGPTHFEHPFLTLKQGLECLPGWDGRVLVSEQGSVVGLATLIPRWGADEARVLDFVIHPAFASGTALLLESLSLSEGAILAYAAAGEDARIAALRGAGLRIAGRAPARCGWTGSPPADRLILRR